MTISERRARLKTIGVILLLAGFGAGDYLYWRSLQSGAEPDDDAVLRGIEQTRAYDLAVQRNVGSFGLLMSQWSEQLGHLGRPRAVAVEVALAAGLAAGTCFWVAARLPRE